MRKNLNKFFVILLTLQVVSLLAIYIWDNYDGIFEKFKADIMQENIQKTPEKFILNYSSEINSLDPASYDENIKSRISHIYEPLVSFDKNLRPKSGLAFSWGILSPKVWEFNLRKKVKFHNGDNFHADDVIASFKRAKNLPESRLKNLLENISKIKKINNTKIRIYTKTPDPSLLSKLTSLYILPKSIIEDKNSKTLINDMPVGTGPYQFKKWEKGKEFVLTAFERYYGRKPYYKNLIIQTVPNKYLRIAKLKNKEVDILLNVPTPNIPQIKEKFNYEIKTLPALESNFIIFNIENNYLKNKNLRKALNLSINKEDLKNAFSPYINPLNQFISSGVFGYAPSIKTAAFNIKEAKKMLKKEFGKERVFLALELTKDYESLGQYLQRKWLDLNIKLKLNLHDTTEDLLKNLSKGKSDMYLLGWKFTSGIADDFYKYLFHSKDLSDKNKLGEYNGAHLSNDIIDDLIEKSSEELNEEKRLSYLHKIMKILVEKEVIGLPLFETEQIYAVKKGINFYPRIDGSINLLNIK